MYILICLAVLLMIISLGVIMSCRRASTRPMLFGLTSTSFACLVLLVANGFELPWNPFGRAYVVILDETYSPDSLEKLLAQLSKSTPVAFIQLRKDSVSASTGECTWTTAGKSSRNVRDALVNSCSINATDADWLTKVTEASGRLHSARSEFERILRVASTVVLYEDNANWKQLTARGSDVNELVATLRNRTEQMFILDLDQKKIGGRLFLSIDEQPLPPGTLESYIQSLDLCIESDLNQPTLSPKSAVFELDGHGLSPSNPLVFLQNVDGKFSTSVGLGSLVGTSAKKGTADKISLGVGFHKLDVALSFDEDGLNYRESFYFEVDSPSFLVMQPEIGLGRLADESWLPYLSDIVREDKPPTLRPASLPNAGSVRSFLAGGAGTSGFFEVSAAARAARDFASSDKFVALPTRRLADKVSQLSAVTAKKWGEEDRSTLEAVNWAARLDSSRSLLLVEPTASQLIYINSLLELEQMENGKGRIEKGLNVFVVVPPVFDGQADWPKWLQWSTYQPLVPASPPVAEQLKVYADSRIYFVPSNSRGMMVDHSERDKQTFTPLQAQQLIINAIYDGVGAVFPDAASGLVQSPQPEATQIKIETQEREKNNVYHSILLGSGRTAFTADGISVFPPITLTPTSSTADETFGEAARNGLLPNSELAKHIGYYSDISAEHIGLRIQTLLSGQATGSSLARTMIGPEFEPIRVGHLHPHTNIVLFVRKDEQFVTTAKPLRAIPAFAKPADLSAARVEANFDARLLSSVGELAKMGIRVFVVAIDLGRNYNGEGESRFRNILEKSVVFEELIKYNHDPNSLNLDQNYIRQFDVSYSDGATKARANAVATARVIVDEIRSLKNSTISKNGSGRIVDERAWPRKDKATESAKPSAPRVFTLLRPVPSFEEEWKKIKDWEPPFASIHDSNASPVLQDIPAIVGRTLGEGHVVICTYSPFDERVWHSDSASVNWDWSQNVSVTDRARFKSLSEVEVHRRMQGWGVQRLVDLVRLTSKTPAITSDPILRGARTYADGSTLDLMVWVGLPTEAAVGTPQIEHPDTKTKHTFDLISIDPERRTAVYRFVAGKDWGPSKKPCKVFLTSNKFKDVYLELSPATGTGANAYEVLSRLSWLTDGSHLSALNTSTLSFTYSTTSMLSIMGCSLLLGLLSPACRKWAALELWFSRKRELRQMQNEASTELEPQTLAAEWGVFTGPPQSGRRAGVPAGSRAFETGDTLAAVVPGSMIPFTEIGKLIGLQPCTPIVRVRHLGAAEHALILLDTSPSLFVPEPSRFRSKPEFAQGIATILATLIWTRGGTISIASLQDPQNIEECGPGSEEEMHAVMKRLLATSSSNSKQQLPEVEFSTVYIISDLMGVDERGTISLMNKLGQEGIGIRLAHVCDPDELRLVGLCWDVTAKSFVDRSTWELEDLATAHRQRIARFEYGVESNEGIFVSLQTALAAEDISEILATATFV